MPTNPHPTPEAEAAGLNDQRRFHHGLLASVRVRELLGAIFPDALVASERAGVYLVEHKHQARFEAPPYDGHGLPAGQADRYARFYDLTGIPTLLDVREPDGTGWRAWLPTLEAGEHFDTAGTVKTPRRVYPLANFHKARSEAV